MLKNLVFKIYQFFYFVFFSIYLAALELELLSFKKHANISKKLNEFLSTCNKPSDAYFIITGANSGIGLENTKILACEMGCNVIMACRSKQRAQAALDTFKDKVKTGKVLIYECDVSSLESVKKFTTALQQDKIDVQCVILNAGVMAIPYESSKDGYEGHVASNYLGHALLCLLLSEHQPAGKLRFLMVSSLAHGMVWNMPKGDNVLAPEFLQADSHNRFYAYTYSKFLQIAFTIVLNKYFRAQNWKQITINALHPGVVDSNIGGNLWVPFNYAFKYGVAFFCRTPREGAACQVTAALDERFDTLGGLYLADNAQVTSACPTAQKPENQMRIFKETVNALKAWLSPEHYQQLAAFAQ